MTGRRRQAVRIAIGIVAAALLLGLTAVTHSHERGSWPAVVVAGRTFRVSALSPGRYAWTLEDGARARGPGLLRQHLLQAERSDLLELSLRPELVTGARVNEGEALGTLDSSYVSGERARIAAEREALAAQLALLEAGARPEELQQARASVAVAEARAAGLKPMAERERSLRASGAGSVEQVELAESAAAVAARELELARAGLKLIDAPARAEEIASITASLKALDASLAAMDQVAGEQQLTTPIAGVLELGGSLEPDGEPVVLRVHDLDTMYVRVRLPPEGRGDLGMGDQLRFHSAAAEGEFLAEVVEIAASAAVDINGSAWFWAVARLQDGAGLLPGYPGTAERVGGAP